MLNTGSHYRIHKQIPVEVVADFARRNTIKRTYLNISPCNKNEQEILSWNGEGYLFCIITWSVLEHNYCVTLACIVIELYNVFNRKQTTFCRYQTRFLGSKAPKMNRRLLGLDLPQTGAHDSNYNMTSSWFWWICQLSSPPPFIATQLNSTSSWVVSL